VFTFASTISAISAALILLDLRQDEDLALVLVESGQKTVPGRRRASTRSSIALGPVFVIDARFESRPDLLRLGLRACAGGCASSASPHVPGS